MFIIILKVESELLAGQLYVSLSGSDSNPGTIDLPLATIVKAHSLVAPGDTIYVRGGVYSYASRINLTKSGTATSKICLYAYSNERPILDFSLVPEGSSNQGIRLQGWYWHIRGLEIRGAGDNGMLISNGSYNTIEFCAFYNNRDTGLQLDQGAAYNQIVNCDSYNNVDSSHGNADGFAPKLTVGAGNYFYGCRAWNNSDDGFDGYLRGADNISTVLENCWAFMNGYLANGSASMGNGNGFKLGGGDNGNSDSLKHNVTLINCIAFDNRVKGFDQNNNRGSMTLYHTTAYRNGTNYSLSGAVAFGKTITIVNAVALGPAGSIANFAIQQTNSWMPSFTVTAEDFLSLDTTGVRGPRMSDGSLPNLSFLRLAVGSDLIDAGTNIGRPYYGSAPDLGAFEFIPATQITRDRLTPKTFSVSQNYPNPFNPRTSFYLEIPQTGNVTIRVFNATGQLIRELLNDELHGGIHIVQWDGATTNGTQSAAGVYFAQVKYQSMIRSIKLILLK